MRWFLQAPEWSDPALSFAFVPSKRLPSGRDGSGGFFNCALIFALRVKEKIHIFPVSIYLVYINFLYMTFLKRFRE